MEQCRLQEQVCHATGQSYTGTQMEVFKSPQRIEYKQVKNINGASLTFQKLCSQFQEAENFFFSRRIVY